MKSLTTICVAILFIILSHTEGNCQIETFPKNYVYGTISFVGLGAGASLNYERTINHNLERPILQQINARAAIGTYAVWDSSGKIAMLGATGLTGKSNHRLETMMGIAASKNDALELNTTDINLAVSVGYRIQKQQGRFLFRTGVGWPEGIYLGFGFTF